MIEGDSIAGGIVRQVRQLIHPGERVMVFLDGCHTRDHVLAELEAYGPLVAEGSYIIAMDEENYAGLLDNCPKRLRNRLYRCLDFAPNINLPGVPDPYFGEGNGFERVYQIVETCMAGLLKKIADDHGADA